MALLGVQVIQNTPQGSLAQKYDNLSYRKLDISEKWCGFSMMGIGRDASKSAARHDILITSEKQLFLPMNVLLDAHWANLELL